MAEDWLSDEKEDGMDGEYEGCYWFAWAVCELMMIVPADREL